MNRLFEAVGYANVLVCGTAALAGFVVWAPVAWALTVAEEAWHQAAAR